jgi:hypothetical protein
VEEAKDQRRNYRKKRTGQSTRALDKSMAAALESGRHGSDHFWTWSFRSSSQFGAKPWKKQIVPWLDGDMVSQWSRAPGTRETTRDPARRSTEVRYSMAIWHVSIEPLRHLHRSDLFHTLIMSILICLGRAVDSRIVVRLSLPVCVA